MGFSSVNLGLVAMPWPAFNRPSLQLAALKGYLAQKGVACQCLHPYLGVAQAIGPELYQWLTGEVWLCEAFYSAILFPEQQDETLAFIHQGFHQAGRRHELPVESILARLEKELDRWLTSVAWDEFYLVGFSICLNQLLASLTAISRLRNRFPTLPIVVGGSSATPEAAKALTDIFAIDYVICGEGEQALASLCQYLAGQEDKLTAQIYGRDQGWGQGQALGQMADLGKLALPDYDDYFQEIPRHFAGGFRPVLPVEFSRGCWWAKCNFCNLNKQWQGYRYKRAKQMISEVEALSQRYSCLDFTFTDNALPIKEGRIFFEHCAGSGRDYSFFAEIRASQRGKELALMRQGGLREVQVGIESFSTALLQRLNKGMRVIDNLAIMRDAVQFGVVMAGNLLISFPGSTAAEVAETLVNLDFVFPFTPLTTATFFLGSGSVVDCRPQDFGVTARLPHAANKKLFPAAILAKFPQLIKGYRGDRQRQEAQWRPVVKKVAQWQSYHDNRDQDIFRHPLLSYRDGRGFIDIRQELSDGQVLRHRLRGISRAIYLSCREMKSMADLLGLFPQIRREKMVAFLAAMVQKRLIFTEDDDYLTLAVHAGRGGE